MRRSAGQGRRRDRDREGLESLRLRQRRHEAASRRAAGVRSRYRDAVPLRRSLPDVLRAHGRSPAAHQRLARQPRRRPRLPEGSGDRRQSRRSEEHTSELQSLMRISYAVFCLKKKKKDNTITTYKNLIETKQKD